MTFPRMSFPENVLQVLVRNSVVDAVEHGIGLYLSVTCACAIADLRQWLFQDYFWTDAAPDGDR